MCPFLAITRGESRIDPIIAAFHDIIIIFDHISGKYV